MSTKKLHIINISLTYNYHISKIHSSQLQVALINVPIMAHILRLSWANSAQIVAFRALYKYTYLYIENRGDIQTFLRVVNTLPVPYVATCPSFRVLSLRSLFTRLCSPLPVLHCVAKKPDRYDLYDVPSPIHNIYYHYF